MNLNQLKEDEEQLRHELSKNLIEQQKIILSNFKDKYGIRKGDIILCNGIQGEIIGFDMSVGDVNRIKVFQAKSDGTIGTKERFIYVSDLGKGYTIL